MSPTIEVPIAEVKSRFSEYASRSAHSHEHFIITRRGKPLAALVGLDDLARIDSLETRRGLAQAIASWEGAAEVREGAEEIYSMRSRQAEGRHVSF
ncbi:MAG TPA: type II toxin-antitoxin system Phd/YefM family antitoxin [Verrucomicrobia bacterium]|nr:type II toxin-antitoxin system Phd/YefM family antitoxin [Verrucomicrobiota bacterium]